MTSLSLLTYSLRMMNDYEASWHHLKTACEWADEGINVQSHRVMSHALLSLAYSARIQNELLQDIIAQNSKNN